ncbi:MAG: lysophospholipid acyltransferase family protein [Thermoanaerobaculia bacterium]
MRVLRCLGVWIAIAFSTVLYGLPAIPAAFFPPRGDWFLRFARGWARTILAFSGVSVRLLRGERLRTGGGFVIVANHESFSDILVLLAYLPMQLRFLAKRSIFRVPILGWSIRAAGFVPVDRGNKTRSAATVEAALALLQEGRSLVLFPEETRTRTGELLPFKRGAALLALRSGFPLLPLGLAGTRRILPRGSLLMTPGQVVLSVGEPIAVSGRSARDRDGVTEEVRREILKLRGEASLALSS